MHCWATQCFACCSFFPSTPNLAVSAAAQANDGTVAGPQVPEGEGQSDVTSDIIEGATDEYEGDEVGGEEEAAERLEDEGGGWRQRRDVGGGAKDEGEGGGGFNEDVTEEGDRGGGDGHFRWGFGEV